MGSSASVLATESLLFVMNTAMTIVALTEFCGQNVAAFWAWVVMYVLMLILLLADTGTMIDFARRTPSSGTDGEGQAGKQRSFMTGWYANKHMFRFNCYAWATTVVSAAAVFSFFSQTGFKKLEYDADLLLSTVGQIKPYIQWGQTMQILYIFWPGMITLFMECAYSAGKHEKGA